MDTRELSILLVEDNPGDVRLIKELLKDTDHAMADLRTAGTLKEAQDAAEPHGSVATILLDLDLPDSGGVGTLLRIREAYRDSAIIVLTGLDDERTALQALREGAQSYMTKNEINASLLERTLRYSMERHGFIQRLREEEQRSAESRAREEHTQQALEREKEMHRSKSRFLSLVSHELRTPLAVIMGSADLIERHAQGATEERLKAHATRIQRKVRQLTGLLNDVLSLEKMEQEALHCRPSGFDVAELCAGLIAEMNGLARTGQRLVHEHTGEERRVSQDEQMVQNVLTNLLSNAIKYSPEGGRITLASTIADGRILFAVKDEGIGIPQQEQKRLFDEFFRGSNTTSVQGIGLGLSIIKKYLDLMGGSIAFTSEPGATVFTVDLPRYADA